MSTDRYPYEKFRADWLENTRLELAGSGLSWPKGLCMVDLQEMASALRAGVRRAKIPSTAQLARRWGRSQSFARSVLRSEEWCGQTESERRAWAEWVASSAGSNVRKRVKTAEKEREVCATQSRGASEVCATSTQFETWFYDGLREVCARCARGVRDPETTGALISIPHTSDLRPDTHTSGKPSDAGAMASHAQTAEQDDSQVATDSPQLRLSPSEQTTTAEPHADSTDFQQVLDTYISAATARSESRGDRKPRTPRMTPSKGRGRHLSARIGEHGVDSVSLVVRWWQLSDDDRAQLLRGEVKGKGPYSWDTVCRPGNFETYLEMAERWDDLGASESSGVSSAELDGGARAAWVFLRRCVEDPAFYAREVPDKRADRWPHRLRATLIRLGTSVSDVKRSTMYELDRLEPRFIEAHKQITTEDRNG